MNALPISDNSSRRAAIWIRVSSEEQAQGDSPAHHKARAEMYCASRGWQVVEVYDLAGVSGKSVMDHPECKRMMADVRRGHIQALVFSKLARFSRNAQELMAFSEFFQQNHADLISLSESIDTSSPAGRLFFNLVASMAQWEREEITDRIKSSVMVRAKLGKPLSGKAPYGYKWKDKKLVVNRDEAPVRRMIYELFDQHQRIKTVARILNERGYRTRIGKQWSDMAVRFQLKDPTAKGIHRRNYTRNQGQGKTWALKPESEHIFNEVEAVVPAELWERCNKILDGRYMKRERPAKKPAHLFSGFVVCASCKRPMYVPTRSPKYTCQKCRNKIPCAVLEDLFLEEVKDYLINPANVKSYLAKAGEALAERQELLGQRQKEAAKIKADTDRMLRLYLDGSVTSEQFKQFNQPLVDQTRQVDDEVGRLQSEIDILKIDSLSGEQLVAEALDLHARWPTMTPDEKRRVIEQMVRSIEIGDGEANLHLIQLPSYKEITNWQNTYRRANTAVRSCRGSEGARRR
ncbi:MAG: recombinase family protein [Verrucomicrobiaceae bacterium]|nr:recombinase family protein [Verrucomicrobiaceae bacterium]